MRGVIRRLAAPLAGSAAVLAALAAVGTPVASARCNRLVTDPRGPGAVYIAKYRHVSCDSARKLARSYQYHFSRSPSLHYGFHCRDTGLQAGGGQYRCTKSGGKLVVLDFE